MTIKTKQTKRYYIYQKEKNKNGNLQFIRKGSVSKRHPSMKVQNDIPTLVRQSSIVVEIIFYFVMGLVFVAALIFARPLCLIPLFLCSRFFNPFNLKTKTNFLIPCASGSIEFDDYRYYSATTEIFEKPRKQFLHIRFYSLTAAFLFFVEIILERYFVDHNDFMLLVLGGYIIVAGLFEWMAITGYRKALKNLKDELSV